jgi:hypothetical protein
MKFKCVWTSAVLTKGFALPGIFIGGLAAVLEDGRYLIVSDTIMQDSNILFLEEALDILESTDMYEFIETIRTGIIEIKLDRLTADFADEEELCKPWKLLSDGSIELDIECNLIKRIRKKESGNNFTLPMETINLVNGNSIDIYDSKGLRIIDDIAKKIIEVLESRGCSNLHPLYQITDKTRWTIALLLGQWYAYDTARILNAA